MRRLLLAGVLVLALAEQAVGSCHVNCDTGFRSTCVQRGEHCECSCLKDASNTVAELRALLETAGVTKAGIEKGVQLFNDRFNSGERNFTVKFSDEGQTVTITTANGKSNNEISVT